MGQAVKHLNTIQLARKIMEINGGAIHLARLMHAVDDSRQVEAYKQFLSTWAHDKRTASVAMLRVLADALRKDGWL